MKQYLALLLLSLPLFSQTWTPASPAVRNISHSSAWLVGTFDILPSDARVLIITAAHGTCTDGTTNDWVTDIGPIGSYNASPNLTFTVTGLAPSTTYNLCPQLWTGSAWNGST